MNSAKVTKMERPAESSAPDKVRDHVGLLQNCFQALLHEMFDILGKIQRDAALDPSTCTAYTLFTYDEIPAAAKSIVEKVLLIDALIDEAVSTTCLAKEESEIFAALKQESDEYARKIQELPELDKKAELWLGRVNQVLEMITKKALAIEDEEEDMC